MAFDKEAGTESLPVLEEWIGLSAAEMDSPEAGFTLREERIGDYDWSIFTRQNEETGFFAFVAVTVVEEEAYLMALFAPQEVGGDLSQQIIESVQILE